MTTPTAPIRIPARDRILDVAARLFYAEGIRAVGIDRIIAEAGVAKMSFYNNFASKDDLILAYVETMGEAWRAWFTGELKKRRREGVLVVFDVLAARLARRDFRGCAFINSMVEAADFDSAVHQAALSHKRQVIGILEQWLHDQGVKGDIASLAYQLLLLLDGAIVAAVRDGKASAAQSAKEIAGALLGRDAKRPKATRRKARSAGARRPSRA